mgnify:CR=1 FL=1
MKTPNYGQMLDSRDLEERREELESELETLRDAVNEAAHEDKEAAEESLAEWEREYASELRDLNNAQSEVCEWCDGATLVPERQWVDYVQELLEECGDIPKDVPWYVAIDWDKTAENVKADYSEIEICGETYIYRNC